jgi:hypothetical protein
VKTLVLWILGLLALWIASIPLRLANSLVVDQIKVWLRRGLRGLVRQQAKRMPDAARWEEEWSAHVDGAEGDLAKWCVALPLLITPARLSLERWRDSDEPFKSWAARMLLDHGWLIVLVTLVGVWIQIPPSWERSAAYVVLLTLATLAALFLSRVRTRLTSLYEDNLGFWGRVSFNALLVPFVVSMTVVWLKVPASGPVPTRMTPRFEHAQPTIFYVPPSAVAMDERVTFTNAAAIQTRIVSAVPRRSIVAVKLDVPNKDRARSGFPEEPLLLSGTQGLPAAFALVVEALDPAQIPGALLASQPIPPATSPVMPRPAAPTNVRIIK